MSLIAGQNSFRLVAAFAFSMGFASITHADTVPSPVSLEWNANPESDVVGYKFYIGESSRAYSQIQDVGSSLGIVLSTLEEGKTYYCAVTAYNASGQESSFSEEVTMTLGSVVVDPDTSGRLVLLEAEDGDLTAPMAVFSDSEASWVDTSEFSQAGYTNIDFNVSQGGDYQIWCRVKAPAESSDSLFVSMNGGTEEVFHVYNTPNPAEGTRSEDWIWRRVEIVDGGPRSYTLDANSHTLRFRVREPGTLLDRVILSSNPAFTPDDSIPRSGDVLVLTGNPSSQTRLPGESVTFAVAAAATGPVSYQWTKNGSNVAGANAPSFSMDNLQVSDAGSYSVSLVNGTASVTSNPATLTVGVVEGDPQFRVSRLVINSDQTVTFHVEGGLESDVFVYASGDLVNWTLIGGQVNSTGSIDVADPDSDGATRRFYRLVSAEVVETSAGDRSESPQGSPTKDLYANPGL